MDSVLNTGESDRAGPNIFSRALVRKFQIILGSLKFKSRLEENRKENFKNR